MITENLYMYGIFLLGAFLIGYILNNFFLKKSIKYALKKANEGGVRWASQTKPVSGGITFYSIFILTVIAAMFIGDTSLLITGQNIAIMLVLTISFFMGLADDMISTSPYFKFIVQIVGALLLINSGIYIQISPNEYLNYALTIFWVVGIMNSINMLDNMDAITGCVTVSILIGVVVNILLLNSVDHSFYLLVTIGTLGALFSYLIFNWPPSKMYMGDNGSQFLGALLAVLGIVFFWNGDVSTDYGYNTKQFLTVLLAFLIPITDTTTVTINRLLRKQSPFVGGRDHTTHHLSYLGLSNKYVALTLFAISIISVLLSVYLINFVEGFDKLYTYLFGGFALVVFLSLYLNTKITKPNN